MGINTKKRIILIEEDKRMNFHVVSQKDQHDDDDDDDEKKRIDYDYSFQFWTFDEIQS